MIEHEHRVAGRNQLGPVYAADDAEANYEDLQSRPRFKGRSGLHPATIPTPSTFTARANSMSPSTTPEDEAHDDRRGDEDRGQHHESARPRKRVRHHPHHGRRGYRSRDE